MSDATRRERADTEATLFRLAICAFTYYPDKPTDELGYTVDEDVTWCSKPLASLPEAQLTAIRASMQALITDPAADRQAFIAYLAQLAGE